MAVTFGRIATIRTGGGAKLIVTPDSQITISSISRQPSSLYTSSIGNPVNWSAGSGGILSSTSPPTDFTSPNHFVQNGSSTPPRSSNLLVIHNFGFDIPAGATILGIEATIRVLQNNINNFDFKVSLVDSTGVISSTSKAKGSGFEFPNYLTTDAIYGGSTDLWNATWAPSDINDSDFGIAFGFTLSQFFTSVRLYYPFIKIYYQ